MTQVTVRLSWAERKRLLDRSTRAGKSMGDVTRTSIHSFLERAPKLDSAKKKAHFLKFAIEQEEFDRLADFAAANKVSVGFVVCEAIRQEVEA